MVSLFHHLSPLLRVQQCPVWDSVTLVGNQDLKAAPQMCREGRNRWEGQGKGKGEKREPDNRTLQLRCLCPLLAPSQNIKWSGIPTLQSLTVIPAVVHRMWLKGSCTGLPVSSNISRCPASVWNPILEFCTFNSQRCWLSRISYLNSVGHLFA